MDPHKQLTTYIYQQMKVLTPSLLPQFARTKAVLAANDIDLVLDVGANKGQFARQMRGLGYSRQMMSFEPILTAYKALAQFAADDPKWTTLHYALGSEDGEGIINVSKNLVSSTLREFTDDSPKRNDSGPKTIRSEKIRIRALDSVWPELELDGYQNIFLKIDTQGFENEVLNGATHSLPRVRLLQLECSFKQIYAGEMGFFEWLPYLKGKGFEFIGLEPGYFSAKTGELYQVDATFRRIP